uniref:ADP-ribosylation factor-like protein 6 n=1 Tax=Dermatophagoides pteronyssinus TaxID=6956 RepID=A0A6P6YJK7_DERPT|nr:ADP-ribosylation factor-like protein 6 [Dermatophagoides pteronyssinus]
MSSFFGRFLTILGLKRREANVLVVGLDNSGKSTILNYLKRKEDQVEEIVPTVGYTVERLSGIERNRSGITLTAFDMSGQGRYRNLWEHYYDSVEGIIFVVDSTDALRLVVARDELEMLLKHQQVVFESNKNNDDHESSKNPNESINNGNNNDIRQSLSKPDIPILFFANKMDLKEALSTVKICQTLGLHQLPHKQWHVQSSNALTGDGVQEGIDWLLVQLANNKKLQNSNNQSSNQQQQTLK